MDLRVNVFAKAGVLFPGLADFLLGFFMRTYRLAARLQLIQPISVDWVIKDIEKRLKHRLERDNADANDCDLVQNLIDARTEVRRRNDKDDSCISLSGCNKSDGQTDHEGSSR